MQINGKIDYNVSHPELVSGSHNLKMKSSYVYLLSNKYGTTFYIGATTNLDKSLSEHHDETASKYTKKYSIKYLVYFETFTDIEQAIAREKQLKNWHKEWKLNLIKTINPTLKTLEY